MGPRSTVLSLRGQSTREAVFAKVKCLSASSLSPELPPPDMGQLQWRQLDLNAWFDLSEEHGSVLAAREHCITALHERDFGDAKYKRLTYRLCRVEVDSSDRSFVSRKLSEEELSDTFRLRRTLQFFYLVLDLPAFNIPYTHCSVSTSDANSLASVISAPCSSQQGILEARGCTHKHTMYAGR